jgi:hypothetical protein
MSESLRMKRHALKREGGVLVGNGGRLAVLYAVEVQRLWVGSFGVGDRDALYGMRGGMRGTVHRRYLDTDLLLVQARCESNIILTGRLEPQQN